MVDRIKELINLRDHSFTLWTYHISHSELEIRAKPPEATFPEISLIFVQLAYLQLPVHWEGNFMLGTNVELLELIKMTGPTGLYQLGAETIREQLSINLFKIDTFSVPIRIVGNLNIIRRVS